MKKVGAGRNWKCIDEQFDASIIKQTSGLSCVAAVGEMLLERRGISLSQTQIIDIIGEPAYFSSLAKILNLVDVSESGKKWRGVTVAEENLNFLLKNKTWRLSCASLSRWDTRF